MSPAVAARHGEAGAGWKKTFLPERRHGSGFIHDNLGPRRVASVIQPAQGADEDEFAELQVGQIELSPATAVDVFEHVQALYPASRAARSMQ